MKLREDIEYVVHCEADGTIIGPLSKLHAHLPGVRETLTHYSSWAMLYNLKTGKYGLQLKNPKKHDKFGAGRWDMAVGGHNCYVEKGNSFIPMLFNETICKEANEEIGLDLTIVDSFEKLKPEVSKGDTQAKGFLVEKFHYKTTLNNEFVGLFFIVVSNEDVTFTDDEVVDFKWLSPEELQEFIKADNLYCEPLPLVFKKAEEFRKRL